MRRVLAGFLAESDTVPPVTPLRATLSPEGSPSVSVGLRRVCGARRRLDGEGDRYRRRQTIQQGGSRAGRHRLPVEHSAEPGPAAGARPGPALRQAEQPSADELGGNDELAMTARGGLDAGLLDEERGGVEQIEAVAQLQHWQL